MLVGFPIMATSELRNILHIELSSIVHEEHDYCHAYMSDSNPLTSPSEIAFELKTRSDSPKISTSTCHTGRQNLKRRSSSPIPSTLRLDPKRIKLRSPSFKIALVQLAVGADKSKNIAAAVKEIHKAKQNGAQMVALPECFNSPYGTGFFKEYAEEVPSGETSQALSKAAAEAGVCVVGGTVPERCGDRIYNTCTVWDAAGKLLAQHRKMHLFDIDIPGKITFKESDILTAGDQLSTFDFAGLRVGLGICYDLRFQEMAQLMAKEGCSLLIYPGAFNMTTGPKHWELLGRARATDQQLWVALVSPARDEAAGYVAWGHSTLIDPWGRVVDQLDEKAGTLIADIDLKTVEEVRTQIPIRSQRRTDIYDVVTFKMALKPKA